MKIRLASIAAAIGLATGLSFGATAIASATECGTDKTIDIAEMNWASAAALAQIHNFILGKGYGCNVEIVAGDTVPTLASMIAKGRPAIAPELWPGTSQDAWDQGIKDSVVASAGLAISDGAVEGWWIPKYVADANPGLKAVEDLPKYAKLFADPDQPEKGRFYSCPPGWGCEIANAALFEAYGLKTTYNLFSPGSGGNLDAAITRAFTRQEPIVFYYWGPTAIMGKYDMVQLKMPPYNAKIWKCNITENCSPKGKSSFATPPVIVGVAAWILKDAPAVGDYLSKVGLTNAQISQMLSWGDEHKANSTETAKNFLRTEEAVWTKWVPANVAVAVKAALK